MRIGIAAGLVACSIAMVGSAIGVDTLKEVRELKVGTPSGAALTVKTANGGIEIVPTSSSEMRIKATVTARSKERLDAVHISATNDATAGNNVRVDFPPAAKGEEEGCSLVIEVPRATNVKLVATNGRLSIRGTAGSASLETSNGGVTIEGHDGPATIRTSNGQVTASSVTGSASIKTSNGPVTVRGARHPFAIETTNGPVQVTLAQSFEGVVSIATSNGRISLPKDATIESQSGNKGYGNAEARFSVGAGKEASSIRTSNGPVDVKPGT